MRYIVKYKNYKLRYDSKSKITYEAGDFEGQHGNAARAAEAQQLHSPPKQ